ncbi:MAG: winged helix-turn-helix domain-containing protein [Armatimonadetes bacterium]|nr:winged helix-turn-helix domain-containing protein [Armatimonadota bacterium]
MDNEVDILLGSAIDSLVKLDILFYLHARPGAVQKPNDIAERLGRSQDEITRALDGLAQAHLVDRFPLGTGRHVVYGEAEEAHVRQLIGILHDRYHGGGESRAQVVRAATQQGAADPSAGPADA